MKWVIFAFLYAAPSGAEPGGHYIQALHIPFESYMECKLGERFLHLQIKGPWVKTACILNTGNWK